MWEEMNSGREGKHTLVAATHEPGYGNDASDCCIVMQFADFIRGQRVHGCMILCCHERQLLGCSHNHTLWRLSYPYRCSPSTHLEG